MWCFAVCGGVRFFGGVLPLSLGIRDAVVFCRLRQHPRFAFGLLALPLCGAAPPFLCCCKEKGGKESSSHRAA
jgi:hypothetical protein